MTGSNGPSSYEAHPQRWPPPVLPQSDMKLTAVLQVPQTLSAVATTTGTRDDALMKALAAASSINEITLLPLSPWHSATTAATIADISNPYILPALSSHVAGVASVR